MRVHHRRSRLIWDETRKPNSSLKQHYLALFYAILYEIQPIRFSSFPSKMDLWKIYQNYIMKPCQWFIQSVLPQLISDLIQLGKTLTIKEYMILLCIVIYCYIIQWIHRVLDAGPMVLILTALIAIFTVGLGDNNDDNHDGLSAYSVFNRGFQRILGSIDVDALVAQHVGGALALHNNNNNNNNNNDDDHDHDPQQQQQQRAGRNAPPADDNMNEQQQQQQQRHRHPGRSRKSGKKARRRNLEIRREMQRQRQAAAAMGFLDERNMDEAMNQLLVNDDDIDDHDHDQVVVIDEDDHNDDDEEDGLEFDHIEEEEEAL